MQIGSLVECVVIFPPIKNWVYPKKKEILTVSGIFKHPNHECDRKGIVLLTFEEYTLFTPPICNKDINNRPHFIELMPPMSMEIFDKILNSEVFEHDHI